MNKEYILGYEIIRKKVKNINVRIKNDMSVFVSAPYNLDKYYIEQFLISKNDIIQKKLEIIKKEYNKYQLSYEIGSYIPYLGKRYKLVYSNIINNIKIDEEYMYINDNNIEKIKKMIDKWYYDRAKEIFSIYMKKYLEIMDEEIKEFKINKIKGKWGYCIPNKKIICLNTDLIKRTIFEIEYVIIHEICHLEIPNHSKQFYYKIEKYMPKYKIAENMLKGK